MTEKEAIMAWLDKTFPGCEFEVWPERIEGDYQKVTSWDWMVGIRRPEPEYLL